MRTEPLRVALAQMNATVGDIEGNTAKVRDLIAEARDDGARLVLFPELALTGYPPDDLLLKTHFVDAAGDALQRGRGGHRGHRGPDRLPRAGRRRLQLAGGRLRREGPGDLPQGVPAQLRRLRRAPLLPGGHAAGHSGAERHRHRPDRVRGHLGAGAAGHHRRAVRRAGDREHLRLPLPPGQAVRARADADPARPRQRVRSAVLQPDRRPGRADLRRLQLGDRPGRRGHRARAAVRGGARVRDDRPGRGRGRPPARRAPSRGRTSQPRARRGGGRDDRPPERRQRRGARRGRRPGGGPALPGGGGLPGARHRGARLRGQERLQARRAGPVGRDRLHAGGADRGGRAGGRRGDQRGHAVALLVGGHPGRRAPAREEPGHAADRARDQRAGRGVRGAARRTSSRAATSTSPRRTCRPASAATS